MDSAPSTTMPAPQQPTTTDEPMDTTPVPQLPPQPAPGTTLPPADEPAVPADEPADLFGPTEPADTPPPADTTPPAETDDMEDLFGGAGAETTLPADTAIPPMAEPAADEPAAVDLFGPTEPADTTPADPTQPTTPAEETPADGETTDDASDLFGASQSILHEPGGLASSEMRQWVDNTGKYSCRGRLVRFLDGKVRLLKDNGRTSTVPLYRLSVADLEFVHRQANAQRIEVVGGLAQSTTMIPLVND
jgi:hypothetical protein